MTAFRLRRVVLAVSATLGFGIGVATAAAAAPARHVLAGTQPSWTAAVARADDVPAAQAGITDFSRFRPRYMP